MTLTFELNGRRGKQAAAGLHPGRPGADQNQRGLRHRRVRGLYGDFKRRGRSLLPVGGWTTPGRGADNGGRTGKGRKAGHPSAGLSGSWGNTMWFLHQRYAHVFEGTPDAKGESHR